LRTEFLKKSDVFAIPLNKMRDLTINHVKNGDDPNVSNYVDTVGLSYDQNTYVITSNDRIYEVADESFFIDLFAFLDNKDVLPPKVN